MKKEDVPQDKGSLGKITREICYATDASGKYTTALSEGWSVKNKALDSAWEDIQLRIATARKKVETKAASPLLFFMEKNLMDIKILSSYTGFYTWQIKRHLKPFVFQKLNEKKLARYATVFNVHVDDLKNMNVHDE